MIDPHPVRIEALQEWAGQRIEKPVGIEIVSRNRISPAGAVSPDVSRLLLNVHGSGGNSELVEVVFKRVLKNEAIALRALSRIPERPGIFPELIDEGTDDQGPWVVMPFYPGRRDHGVPVAVFEALADLHVKSIQIDSLSDELEVIDEQHWRQLCLDRIPYCERALAIHRQPTLERAGESLRERADDERFYHALDTLPKTLIHGDMHGGNVLVGALTDHQRQIVEFQQYPDRHDERWGRDASPIVEVHLIDWGNSRLGPSMLDLPNVTEPGSVAFASYLRRWEELTGRPQDPWLTEVGFLWAKVFVHTLYMMWGVYQATLHGRLAQEDWAGLSVWLDQDDAALRRIGELLGRR